MSFDNRRDSLTQYLSRRRSSALVFPEAGLYPPDVDGMPWYCHAAGTVGGRRNSLHPGDGGGGGGVGNHEANHQDNPAYQRKMMTTATIRRRKSSPKVQVVYQAREPGQTLKSLFSNSNVPGMREFAMSDSYIRRIFWLIAFFALGFLCLMDISVLMADFYAYPITVDVRVKESRKLQFPAITVCNLNILRWSALCNSSVAMNVSIPPELKEKLCGFQVHSDVSLCLYHRMSYLIETDDPYTIFHENFDS